MHLTITLDQLPKGLLIRPRGGLSYLPDPPEPAAVAHLLRPGLEDLNLVTESTSRFGRQVRWLPIAELDEPENLIGTHLLGHPVHGPIAVLAAGSLPPCAPQP